MHRAVALIAFAAALAGTPALAASYPVAGRWTYNYSDEKGPAPQCTGRQMTFQGERRFDTAGAVRDFRNISVTPAGASRYRIVDEIFNGQIKGGHVDMTLRLIDNDHLELTPVSGGTVRLRRCG
jgi:hypothetical protein